MSRLLAIWASALLIALCSQPGLPSTRVTATRTSSLEPELTLAADCYVPEAHRPLVLCLHVWHGDAPTFLRGGEIQGKSAVDCLAQSYFLVVPDLRGGGGSSGHPDASGFGLVDALDATRYRRLRGIGHFVQTE